MRYIEDDREAYHLGQTHQDFDRINVLFAKMEAARDRDGRSFTDTADLSPDERAEWRKLMDETYEHAVGDVFADCLPLYRPFS